MNENCKKAWCDQLKARTVTWSHPGVKTKVQFWVNDAEHYVDKMATKYPAVLTHLFDRPGTHSASHFAIIVNVNALMHIWIETQHLTYCSCCFTKVYLCCVFFLLINEVLGGVLPHELVLYHHAEGPSQPNPTPSRCEGLITSKYDRRRSCVGEWASPWSYQAGSFQYRRLVKSGPPHLQELYQNSFRTPTKMWLIFHRQPSSFRCSHHTSPPTHRIESSSCFSL